MAYCLGDLGFFDWEFGSSQGEPEQQQQTSIFPNLHEAIAVS